ncbi:MAG: phenylacetate--CoA ligase family protein [Planctomycetes bacterium]|nr:phenylacetate--CoA ligase family protein [Planctomycetota bacterium]
MPQIRQEDTLDRAGLDRVQRSKLGHALEIILRSNEFYKRKIGGLGFDAARDPLHSLPLTTRGEIQQDQAESPPYGSLLTYPIEKYNRLHQTSGSGGVPMRWLDTPESWKWWCSCWDTIYQAAGVSKSDRLFFPFSFGPFIGFWGAYDAAVAQGLFAIPAGGMTTSARLRYLLDNGVTVVLCTPTYALRLAEVAASEGIDLPGSAVRALIVAGEPGGSIPATRARIETAWGARVFDHPGLTEVGPWGFECVETPGAVHVLETEFVAEVIDPKTEQPLPDGGTGELVLTNLGRIGMPLIRYRTGDRVCLRRERCACGRWFARAEGGVLGRLDDMLIIRGNNVYPAAIEGIVREVPEVAEFRLEVDERASMADLCIQVELTPGAANEEIRARIEAAVRSRLHFRPRVIVMDPGSLPRFEMKAKRLVRRGGAESSGSHTPTSAS